jgi:hypothetical protein
MPDATLYVKHPTSGQMIPVKADVDGKLVISDADPFTVAQDTPENLKHVPHGYYLAGDVYLPLAVDENGVLQTSGAAGAHAIGGASHTVSTLAEINTKVSDATIASTDDVVVIIAATPLDTLAAPSDITDLDASDLAHGLLPKLSGVVTEFLNGLGAFSVPAGGGGGATVAFPGTVVWTGASNTPTSFTDLDLSAVVGANAAIVILKVDIETTGTGQVTFRTNGETIASYIGYMGIVPSTTTPYMGYAVVVTDSAGVVEWKAAAAKAGNILTVVAYAKA